MIPYRKLAIIEAEPGLVCFKTFISKNQRALYRLEILRKGDARVWNLYKYPFPSLGLNGTPSLITANAAKQDLLDVLPDKWTIPEFFAAMVFFQIGKKAAQNS